MPSNELKMPQINKTFVSGRLTRDAEHKTLPSGMELTKFGLAVTEGFGEKESTYFIDVCVWGKAAEYAAKAKKGYPVYIEGGLRDASWTKDDGTKVSKMELHAHRTSQLTWDNAKDSPDGGNRPANNEVEPGDDLPF